MGVLQTVYLEVYVTIQLFEHYLSIFSIHDQKNRDVKKVSFIFNIIY